MLLALAKSQRGRLLTVPSSRNQGVRFNCNSRSGVENNEKRPQTNMSASISEGDISLVSLSNDLKVLSSNIAIFLF